MPILFRCFQCQRVLRTGRTKAGSVVTCPKCGAELIVPEPPDEAPGSAELDSAEASSGSSSHVPSPKAVTNLADIRPEDIRVEPGVVRPGPPVEQASVTAFEVAGRPAPLGAISGMEFAFPPKPSNPEPDFPAINIKHEPILDAVASSVIAARSPAPRPRDIPLPRAAVVAWSMSALIAIVFAFVAGLLIGHFLWGVRVITSSS
jgi:hypothetical protein